MSRCLRLLLLVGLLAPASVFAEEPVDAEVTTLRGTYEYGRYAEVLERAGMRIDRGRLADKDLAELHKLAGLSAFNLNRTEDSVLHGAPCDVLAVRVREPAREPTGPERTQQR